MHHLTDSYGLDDIVISKCYVSFDYAGYEEALTRLYYEVHEWSKGNILEVMNQK